MLVEGFITVPFYLVRGIGLEDFTRDRILVKTALASTAPALSIGLLEMMGGGCRPITRLPRHVSVLVEMVGSDACLMQLYRSGRWLTNIPRVDNRTLVNQSSLFSSLSTLREPPMLSGVLDVPPPAFLSLSQDRELLRRAVPPRLMHLEDVHLDVVLYRLEFPYQLAEDAYSHCSAGAS